MTQPTQEIGIMAEPTANPQVCRFTVDRPLHEGGSVHCQSREDAAGSPLLERLFAIDDVREILVMGPSVTVAKNSGRPWQQVGPQVGAAIRAAIQTGEPLIDPDWSARTPAEDEIRSTVEKLLAEEINPQIASHGGHVQVADVKGTTVYVVMGGGCQGCASSQLTLRTGVESAIRRAVPAVTEIVDVTDHAAGANPYYS